MGSASRIQYTALLTALACGALGTGARGQLVDLQPGRNFSGSDAFPAAGSTVAIEAVDVDNDGDLDVATAGDGTSVKTNRLFINQGGWQGGAAGTFTEETSTRFAGFLDDHTRDLAFADTDDDGDLDLLEGNRGTGVALGVSRFYRNQGGQQLGSLGFFAESTDTDWGSLASVDPSKEVGVQDGQGPWQGWAADCEFADLNDDGALDLLYASWGPHSGLERSRLFLNDGTGTFDELFPWNDTGSDLGKESRDVELVDLDGDYDLDLVLSGFGPTGSTRIFRNDLDGAGTWAGTPFTEVTATALVATGAAATDLTSYEVSYADMDGDGDFDLWVANHEDTGFGDGRDRIVRNDGGLSFSLTSGWIVDMFSQKTATTGFLDLDADGDLDAVLANEVTLNYVFMSGLDEGLDPDTEGLYHRQGGAFGSLATWQELPVGPTSAPTTDLRCADMDGDGDTDAIFANPGIVTANRYWENTLGVPDTHAPTLFQVTVQGDKSDGTDTEIHAQVRDNDSPANVGRQDVRLVYSVDAGDETCVPMLSQGGQQFRGVIPGGVSGTVSYRIEAIDGAGNVGVSGTTAYVQTSTAPLPFLTLGCGTQGVAGAPSFRGTGDPSPGETIRLDLRGAAPAALAALYVTPISSPVPFKGGTLYAFPTVGSIVVFTDPGGQVAFDLVLPGDAIPGFVVTWQWLIQDTTALGNVALSNAVQTTVQP